MGIVRSLHGRLTRLLWTALERSPAIERLALLQGQIAARQIAGLEQLGTLAEAEFRVSSQWGEDGIIEWLVAHSPGIPEIFIEFGVENYAESNTRFLLQNRNWRGLVLDGSQDHVAAIRKDAISWRHDLTALATFITADNIERTIANAGFAGEIGLLSIDIDGNDYWVWQAIGNVSPWLVVVEYNAVFGDLLPLSVPYQADFARTKADPSNLYFGASCKAFAHLAAAKGYVVLGSNRAGNNLFMAREDVAAGLAPRIADRSPRPSRFREARDDAGRLTYLGGQARAERIAALPVADVASGKQGPLEKQGPLYGAAWLAAMAGTA
jgi:hypothetical protein